MIAFCDAKDKYLAAKEKDFRHDKRKKQWRSILESYAVPVLGKMEVKSVRLPDMLPELGPIWEEKTETASRLRGHIGSVLPGPSLPDIKMEKIPLRHHKANGFWAQI